MNIKPKIKKFGKEFLIPRQYVHTQSRIFERMLDGLSHGLEFQSGTGHLDGFFTINVFMRYYCGPRLVPGAFDFWKRISCFDSASDLREDKWFPSNGDDSFDRVGTILKNDVEPFFLEFRSVVDVLKAYEENRPMRYSRDGIWYSTAKDFFQFLGWGDYNLGYCYLYLGNKEKAIHHLTLVIEKYSEPDPRMKQHPDWMKKREATARQGIEKAKLL